MQQVNLQVQEYFQKKVFEMYGKTEIKKISIEPKIEWENVEVPYIEHENYTITIDDGIQIWVYFIVAVLALISVISFNWVGLFIGLLSLFFCVFSLFVGSKYFRKTKDEVKKKEVKKTRVERKEREIPQFRDEIVPGEWAIRKIGSGSLNFGVASINQVNLLTGTGFSKSQCDFNFPMIVDEKSFIKEFHNLEVQLGIIPFILSGEKSSFNMTDEENENFKVSLCGIEKDIMNHFIETQFKFGNAKKKSISSYLVKENYLKNYLIKTSDSFKSYENELLAAILEGQELESICSDWLNKWPKWIKIMEDSRFDSVNRQVVPEFIQFSHQTQYSSFNFYCPDCNKEIANELIGRDYSVHNNEDLSPQRFSKNTRCHYLLETNSWQCPMCDKISISPIPIHKSLDEILMPVYDNLMQENKIIREQDYSDVRRKEIEYKNEMKKEMERMYFENLNGILSLKDDMEKMWAEVDGESEAISFINDSFTRFKNLQSNIIYSIEESNKVIKGEIQKLAEKVLRNVDNVKNREMELLNQELTQLSRAKRIDDERRDSVQRNILEANMVQNQILNTKFTELISTNKQGFSNVTSGVKSLEETNRQGFQNVSSGIEKLDNTTRKGFEDSVKSSKDIHSAIRLNNAMQAACNESMGISPYDDSSILRPGRMLKRGANRLTGSLTGRSSTEIHMDNLETLIK